MVRIHPIVSGITVLAIMASHVGCCCKQCGSPFCWDRCADIPPGAIPLPLGTYACGWQNAHTQAADRNKLTIYRADWVGASAQLGPFGTRRFLGLTELVPQLGQPIVIERSGDEQLDEMRRQTVIRGLEAAKFTDAESLVVIGFAEAEPMYGVEALPASSSYLGGSGISAGNSRGIGGNLGAGRSVQLGL